MDINRTAHVSPILSAQRTANAQLVATVKLANDQIKAEGQSALKLIQSALPANGSTGNHINISV